MLGGVLEMRYGGNEVLRGSCRLGISGKGVLPPARAACVVASGGELEGARGQHLVRQRSERLDCPKPVSFIAG